jgi:hypothetical protein
MDGRIAWNTHAVQAREVLMATLNNLDFYSVVQLEVCAYLISSYCQISADFEACEKCFHRPNIPRIKF